MTPGELFQQTNYLLLSEQKQTLLEMLSRNTLSLEEEIHVIGLVNFLDSFQDTAVDWGVPERKVFPV